MRAGPGGCLLNSFISLSWLPWVCTAAQAFPWSWRASAATAAASPLRSLASRRVGFSSCLLAWAYQLAPSSDTGSAVWLCCPVACEILQDRGQSPCLRFARQIPYH